MPVTYNVGNTENVTTSATYSHASGDFENLWTGYLIKTSKAGYATKLTVWGEGTYYKAGGEAPGFPIIPRLWNEVKGAIYDAATFPKNLPPSYQNPDTGEQQDINLPFIAETISRRPPKGSGINASGWTELPIVTPPLLQEHHQYLLVFRGSVFWAEESPWPIWLTVDEYKIPTWEGFEGRNENYDAFGIIRDGLPFTSDWDSNTSSWWWEEPGDPGTSFPVRGSLLAYCTVREEIQKWMDMRNIAIYSRVR